ncbi:SMI1/KNR4 family protein [Periweissella cryptocerci]|uniref:SMI1/KNR4 family protein n=1 Tax=Periweissella cryptocerci TaxID=2506420 RepID=A0A4P6YSW7_9LACO|nr:YrhA family protein [Periweissella cryptocerci]QBO35727.1 SMI1/KNR4 family protein [Periweissella cryptocerci]
MWKEDLQFIEERTQRRDKKLNEGLSDDEYYRLTAAIKVTLNKVLPSEYIHFLGLHNGIEFNGYSLYGADEDIIPKINAGIVYGIIERNELWYEVEDNRKYLFLGESGESIFVFDSLMNVYRLLDSPSGSEITEFTKLDELLDAFFELSTL